MEVTTVSPSPVSPTGDDLCETDVTNVAIDGVLLLVCLCGLAGNGAVIWLQQRNSISLYIFDLAFVDFLFLLLMVPSTLLYLLETMSCSIIFPLTYLRILFLLSLLPYSLGLYLLTAVSIERCTSILCPLWYNRHCTQQLLEVVNAVLWALSVGFIVTVSSLCLCQENEHCQASLISMYAFNLFLFAPAMIISSTILFIKIKSGPQHQQPKRLDIVILLTVLIVLLFAVPLSLCNFLQELDYITVSFQVVLLLICIHSSIKPLIYFLVGSWRRDCSMGSCWKQCSIQSLRKALQRVFGEVKENPASSDGAALDTGV
ncbi:PREDICTED: mas-related G-protein coupled receptor member H-like [Sturnus vulgaris]|uniref:mas-related G-protein coupled receptor member H-like n=1 Tax=Sturnus vulgaris TaxID=9172 RepID=UPI00071A3D14|nr:PREDICTED: mas-related G-protein coupled receptor member H-like [Sturnus vulgaris]XP_014734233.1 PREDICTED: mas-related G-protein coupled receptor member H-like [Sturnus vulgaris]